MGIFSLERSAKDVNVAEGRSDGWWEGPVSFGQLIIAGLGIVVMLALSFGAFMVSNAERITRLEDGKVANAAAITAAMTAIQNEAAVRQQSDAIATANFDSIRASLTEIKISIAVLTRTIDVHDAAERPSKR